MGTGRGSNPYLCVTRWARALTNRLLCRKTSLSRNTENATNRETSSLNLVNGQMKQGKNCTTRTGRASDWCALREALYKFIATIQCIIKGVWEREIERGEGGGAKGVNPKTDEQGMQQYEILRLEEREFRWHKTEKLREGAGRTGETVNTKISTYRAGKGNWKNRWKNTNRVNRNGRP